MEGEHSKPLVCLFQKIKLTEDELRPLSETFTVVYPSDLMRDPTIVSRVEGINVPSASVIQAKKWLPDMPNVRAIVTMTNGYDHAKGFEEYGIPFANCPDVYTDATADHALSLLLFSGCGILPMIKLTIFADIPQFPPASFRSLGVTGTTLGIFGMGSLGSAIAKRAHGFQMTILYHSRTRKTVEEEAALHAAYFPSLDEMLPQCDYVLASCSLTDNTRRAFSMKQFQLMKSSAIFINVSRGQVVDQDALVSALESGEISGAALDVTDPEPLPPGHPLLKMDNVIVTPHRAFCTSSALRKGISMLKENFEAAIIHKKAMPYLINY